MENGALLMTGGAGGGATCARAAIAQANEARANQMRVWRGLSPSIATASSR